MFVLIPIASFPLVTGRDLVYAIRSMRSGEDKTINGIGSRPKRPVCMQIAGGKTRLLQKTRVWHSLFSSLQVCWLNTVHTFDFLRVEPRR